MIGFPMLDRAAAAASKMRTKWRDPLWAGALDRDEPAALGMIARHGRHFHGFAAQCVGHINSLAIGISDAVAEVTDVIDKQAFTHGARR
jgi:hypothetical protein